ncbi:hypothetical protein VTL71DRAFT_3319 [Oculimacula yallundae]|uniref:Uncharacterized protein n=1 Tax=Oculimacula yallundae TaxID=86028 RepID=A0ABR4C6T3_9HELO
MAHTSLLRYTQDPIESAINPVPKESKEEVTAELKVQHRKLKGKEWWLKVGPIRLYLIYNTTIFPDRGLMIQY